METFLQEDLNDLLSLMGNYFDFTFKLLIHSCSHVYLFSLSFYMYLCNVIKYTLYSEITIKLGVKTVRVNNICQENNFCIGKHGHNLLIYV